ncbi:hypothetical protein BDB00DRAFT_833802 [Zychaea mexicana]|uniref:uncharacterized protein n=1 Tax=Zychaea mexicana TaxID=64656 RepID=UPI0022FDF133|nr:uncharacterized protein BDB00DRAFT_833802 [Zychaea mexicana]KAI9491284.1 hypothetical protein BDB00DRAFT_833802 [Zychaea mexicana]
MTVAGCVRNLYHTTTVPSSRFRRPRKFLLHKYPFFLHFPLSPFFLSISLSLPDTCRQIKTDSSSPKKVVGHLLYKDAQHRHQPLLLWSRHCSRTLVQLSSLRQDDFNPLDIFLDVCQYGSTALAWEISSGFWKAFDALSEREQRIAAAYINARLSEELQAKLAKLYVETGIRAVCIDDSEDEDEEEDPFISLCPFAGRR